MIDPLDGLWMAECSHLLYRLLMYKITLRDIVLIRLTKLIIHSFNFYLTYFYCYMLKLHLAKMTLNYFNTLEKCN